jgi:hypothetical protein
VALARSFKSLDAFQAPLSLIYPPCPLPKSSRPKGPGKTVESHEAGSTAAAPLDRNRKGQDGWRRVHHVAGFPRRRHRSGWRSWTRAGPPRPAQKYGVDKTYGDPALAERIGHAAIKGISTRSHHHPRRLHPLVMEAPGRRQTRGCLREAAAWNASWTSPRWSGRPPRRPARL